MTRQEQALQRQLLKAQDLIRQFGDGSGRHNSNLAAAGRDAEARVNLTEALCRSYSPAVFDDPDLETWVERRVKPQDKLEADLLRRGLLMPDPKDCQIGQIVRLEAVRARGQQWFQAPVELGGELTNSFEFERVTYHIYLGPGHAIEREFWKRVA